MKQVQLITDGACHGNPGPGGWAAILRHGPHRKELFGSSPHTTNNRMEMAAAIEGLRALKAPAGASPEPLPAPGMAPLLKQILRQYAATGLPPAYIPQPEPPNPV